MGRNSSTEKAEALLELHEEERILVLPNVWNPIGARVLEQKGFPAVATSSAAIAESLGYLDGERIRFSTMIDMIGRIARSVDVPVTADIESGYASSTDELKKSIHEVLKAGVVGINLEDSLEEDESLRQRREVSSHGEEQRDQRGGAGDGKHVPDDRPRPG